MCKLLILSTLLVFTGIAVASPINSIVIGQQTFADFEGKGLSPDRLHQGTLDSNRWQVLGASQGDSQFAGTLLSGDYARGQSAGGISTGGLYMFSLPGGKRGLGVQLTNGDFTPGALIWKLANPSVYWLNELALDFEFWWYNDGSRATQITTHARSSGSGWIALPTASLQTPGSADSLGWLMQALHIDMTSFVLAPDTDLALRWQFVDLAGGRSRDEFAFTNLSISANPFTPERPPEPDTQTAPETVTLAAPASLWMSLPLLGFYILKRRCEVPCGETPQVKRLWGETPQAKKLRGETPQVKRLWGRTPQAKKLRGGTPQAKRQLDGRPRVKSAGEARQEKALEDISDTNNDIALLHGDRTTIPL